MRKLIVHADTSKSVGCDAYIALGVDEGDSQEYIENVALDIVIDHIGSYFDIIDLNDVEDDDDFDEYADDICMLDQVEYTIEEYDPEVHDQFRFGGGSFEDDFKWMLAE